MSCLWLGFIAQQKACVAESSSAGLGVLQICCREHGAEFMS